MKPAISKSGVALDEATGRYRTGKPPEYTQAEIIEKTYEYLEGGYKVFPSIAGLARSLSLTRDTIYKKAEGNAELSYMLNLLKEHSEETINENAMIGKFNPSFAIFYAKARLGMKENDAPQAQQVNIQVITNGEAPQISIG